MKFRFDILDRTGGYSTITIINAARSWLTPTLEAAKTKLYLKYLDAETW
jgi:hypothetical protein